VILRAYFLIATMLFGLSATAGEFRIQSSARNGAITWSGAYTAGVCTVETTDVLASPSTWILRRHVFTSNEIGGFTLSSLGSNTFCRLLAVDISTNTPRHFTNLVESYGILETVAGRGQFSGDHINYYSNSLEGGFATNMNLSRPHIAFGDAAGNIFIVDQGSSAIEKVTPDGRIHTYAGTHVAGNNGDGPAPATNLQLRFPNGGWLRSDGTFYILDTENGKVRKVDTNGIMSTIFSTPAPNYMGDGRALWVKSDESLIYFGSGPGVDLNVTTLNKWTPTGGVSVVASNFLDVGNILGDERTGDLYITDRNAYRVYRMNTNGVLTPIAGTGYTTNFPGGGEGGPALSTALILPRSIWFIPNGGYFISEHDGGAAGGNRIWYVDPAGNIHRWVNGSSSANGYGLGDGQWFYANPAMARMSRVRSVNTDPNGNLIIVESNNGYVRRIRFERLSL
jgi:sugar lactone lactonase YvrE